MLPLPKILNTSKAPDPHAEYARFELYLQGRVQAGVAGDLTSSLYDNKTLGYINTSKSWILRMGNVNGAMWGSPWATRLAYYQSSLHYCMCHCYPDAQTYQMAVARNDKVYLSMTGWTRLSSYNSYNRNGYTSGTTSSAGDGASFNSFIFYNPVLRKVQRVNATLANPTFTDFIF